ncbi:MAG: hypothetical protein M0Z61_03665 [Nitrospiraceae bacterium]|nr:hypothetical protein [Nitrospiraceae bacterium]
MSYLIFGWIIAVYLGLVYFSLPALPSVCMKMAERNPQLVNKRWERVLWLLSSFFFIPYMILAGTPSFVAGEVRWFLSSGQGKGE